VSTFTYLGAVITDDTECVEDIKNRIAKGRGALTALKSIWKSRGVSMSTKVRLLNTLAWSAMTHGCESWTINKRDEERMRAFNMLGTPAHSTHVMDSQTHKPLGSLLEKAGVDRSLLEAIKKRKLTYFGHTMWKHDSLEKDIITGTLRGKRARGRKKKNG